MTYADNLGKAIINAGESFTEMIEEVIRKRNEADRAELDALWQRAMAESIKDGEQFTRYHFAALVAAAEREACAKLCESTTAAWTQYLYNAGCIDCAKAIRWQGVTAKDEQNK